MISCACPSTCQQLSSSAKYHMPSFDFLEVARYHWVKCLHKYSVVIFICFRSYKWSCFYIYPLVFTLVLKSTTDWRLLLFGVMPRPFRFTRAITRDRVSTRANQTMGACNRSRKTGSLVEYRCLILEENH